MLTPVFFTAYMTPYMDIRGLQRLLLLLGSKVASGFRELVEGTFTRVMGGDKSLIEVINTNAVSEAPLQQMYRAAMEQNPVASTLEEICNVKKRERDDVEWDLQIAERKFKLEKQKSEMLITMEEKKITIEEKKITIEEKRNAMEKERMQTTFQMAGEAMHVLNTTNSFKSIDERTQVQFQALIKTSMFKTSATKMITTTISTDVENPNSLQPVATTTTTTTVVVANETDGMTVTVKGVQMGIILSDKEAIQVGKIMAAKYRAKYNCEPTKHKQPSGGKYIFVNSYMERDSDMMEEAINEVVAKRASQAHL